MKARIFIVYLFAAVLALGVALLTRKIMQPEDVRKDVEILVARIDMPMGSKIEPENIIWQPWDPKAMNDLYLTKNDKAKLHKLKESFVRIPLVKGEPILEAKTVFPGDKSLLSAVIKPGMRAFTLQMGRKSNLTGLISPGDRVDIVIANKNANDRKGSNGVSAQTIVKKVPVIATDGRLSRDDSLKNPEPPEEVTIEVTPQQAENLTAALRDNHPTVTVYSLNTVFSTELDTTTNTDALPEKPEPEPSLPAVPKTPPPITPESNNHSGRTISVIRGEVKSEINVDVNGVIDNGNGINTRGSQGMMNHDKAR